ncbi:FAD:protein FMN transferase [Aureispira anguillae]|uniref:FAD:protein FMN transferase n=1 Tax=Aureispira anguillae TaxID=2864201 RepID=A0A915YKY5_9BACT|nr:FAD:protein FMN transferase [Aureispira anguillae]BDS14688.1 FAD:protein FMN transferase [Aureispira anguillae]
MKSILFIILSILVLTISCTSESKPSKEKALKKEQFVGQTMGTTFSISYLDSTGVDFSTALNDLLIDINQAVSTYEENSEVSIFNKKADSIYVEKKGHFARNYNNARYVYQQTKGWFNPSVMPLVNYWGFGYTEKKMVTNTDSSTIKDLLRLVQFDSIQVTEILPNQLLLTKKEKGLELDFSAIAKGDAVDQVGLLLERFNIHNYYVEIGGEVRARGTTITGFNWRTGIRAPKEGTAAQELQVAIELPNLSLATSGNYINYYLDKNTGMKYAHTINPHTGYPEKNRLLSASVFTKKCALADAFATSFMAMGLDQAFELASTIPGIDAYFIYSTPTGDLKTKYTSGVASLMQLGKNK